MSFGKDLSLPGPGNKVGVTLSLTVCMSCYQVLTTCCYWQERYKYYWKRIQEKRLTSSFEAVIWQVISINFKANFVIINNIFLFVEKSPLRGLLTPCLSRTYICVLCQVTIYVLRQMKSPKVWSFELRWRIELWSSRKVTGCSFPPWLLITMTRLNHLYMITFCMQLRERHSTSLSVWTSFL